IDPGIGFGKRMEHNLALLGGVGELRDLGSPVLIGPSRKRFIGELTGEKTSGNRLGGTIAACLMGLAAGATIFRVHDVGTVRDALTVGAAIRDATPAKLSGFT
ncbi:MAG: dihydropteroate synthase, partial [Candidatus Hydrogenedentes bacterium]|nr:dihydropteroate synthase [Candidatus Hydrogenedentota bacterium]